MIITVNQEREQFVHIKFQISQRGYHDHKTDHFSEAQYRDFSSVIFVYIRHLPLSPILFLKFFLRFIHFIICVFCLHVYVCTMYVFGDLKNSENGMRSPGTGVMECCKLQINVNPLVGARN